MSLLTAKRAHILVVLSCAARVLRRTQREKADDARAPSTLGAVRPAAARGRLCSRSGRIGRRFSMLGVFPGFGMRMVFAVLHILGNLPSLQHLLKRAVRLAIAASLRFLSALLVILSGPAADQQLSSCNASAPRRPRCACLIVRLPLPDSLSATPRGLLTVTC